MRKIWILGGIYQGNLYLPKATQIIDKKLIFK